MAGLLNENDKGQFEPVDSIANGYWCTNCEVFEDEIYTEFKPDCLSCGCSSIKHTNVKVVSV